MLACDRTVTLVHYDGEAYACTAIGGVSVYAKIETAVQDKGMVAAEVTKIRIPEENLPAGCMPQNGDFVILSGVVESIGGRAELEQYAYASVMAVADNRRGGLPHIALVCR